MCNNYSESGACLGVTRCEEYAALKQERDVLVAEIKQWREENIEYDRINSDQAQEIGALKRERDALRQESSDWRSAKYIAEQKETAVHLALNDMRKERDALLKVREAADALVEVADTIRRIHLGDSRSGLKVAIEAYKEARDG